MGYWISRLESLPNIFNWYLFLVGDYRNHSLINDFFRDDFKLLADRIDTNSAVIQSSNFRLENDLQDALKDIDGIGCILRDLEEKNPGLLMMNKHPREFGRLLQKDDTILYVPFDVLEEEYRSTNALIADLVKFSFGRDMMFIERIFNSREKITEIHGIRANSVFNSHRHASNAPDILALNLPSKNSLPSWKKNYRFEVAFSFPGEFRILVENVALKLVSSFGKDRILYDKFYPHEFARPNLDLYLQNLYKEDSELIVIFLCAEYEAKEWCGLEWRAIRSLINSKRADERIMFIKCGEGDIRGYFPQTDGYIDSSLYTSDDIAGFILKRYEEIKKMNMDYLKAENHLLAKCYANNRNE